MIPAAHRAHYLAVSAGLLLNEVDGTNLRSDAGVRIVALAQQIIEIAGALRDELAGPNDVGNDAPTDAPAVLGANVVSLPLRAIRRV